MPSSRPSASTIPIRRAARPEQTTRGPNPTKDVGPRDSGGRGTRLLISVLAGRLLVSMYWRHARLGVVYVDRQDCRAFDPRCLLDRRSLQSIPCMEYDRRLFVHLDVDRCGRRGEASVRPAICQEPPFASAIILGAVR